MTGKITMPEKPADKACASSGNNGSGMFEKGTPERLATPAELAEFGNIVANPEIEARILALLEEQMKEDISSVEPIDLAEASAAPTPDAVEEIAEKTPEAVPQTAVMEATPESPKAAELPNTEEVAEAPLQPVGAPTPSPSLSAADLHVAARSTPIDLLEFAAALDQH